MRAILFALVILSANGQAQERWQPGEREALKHREQGLSRDDLDARRALSARIIEDLDPAGRARFHAMPLPEKERFLHERADARASKAARELVDSLSEEERAVFESLPEEQRKSRVHELRVEREFSKALAAAAERGLVSEARKAELAALDVAGKAAATFELMKETVLSVHGAEMARLPAHERERLARLPARAFFRDPALFHLRIGHFVSPGALKRMQDAAPEARNRLLAAMVDGQLDALGTEDLRAGAVAEFRAMPRAERERLVEGLGRLLASERAADWVPLGHLLQHLERMPEPERQRFLEMPSGVALHSLQELHHRLRPPPTEQPGGGPEQGGPPPGSPPPDGRPHRGGAPSAPNAGPPGGPPPTRPPGGGRAPAPPSRPRGGH